MSNKKLYYCIGCNLAGDISYEWNGVVACFNCGNELEEKSYEWIKEQGKKKVTSRSKKDAGYP